MRERIDRIARAFERELDAVDPDPRAIEELRVRYLGRKGEVTALLKGLGTIDAAERPTVGKEINELKRRIAVALEDGKERAASRARLREIERDREDVTLPPRVPFVGSLHPVTLVRRELERIFRDLGYTVESGPEVEDDFHNFEALNLPPDHPARDATDTFYVEGGLLLRTHTSPVQIRTMQSRTPPIRMVCPGRVYRRDLDATHLPMFHQLEALVVDEGISMADLKGTMAAVWSRFFAADVAIRLRPGYFPFVEPGAEYDVTCQVCAGSGCRTCKQTGWIELGGAGMVHPAVFEAVGVDGEHQAGLDLGDAWESMLLDLGQTPAELMVRAVRDHLADCTHTLPMLMQAGREASLHFFMANHGAMRGKLFPALKVAYGRWLDGASKAVFDDVIEHGAAHWRDLAQRLLRLHAERADTAADGIAAEVERSLL